MVHAVRLVALFVGLYLFSALVLALAVPSLTAWQFSHCNGTSSIVCSASATFLANWWLALVPFLVVAAVLLNLALARRTAP